MLSVRSIVQNQLRRFGFELRRIEAAKNDVFFVENIPHQIVKPQATYSPWLADVDFSAAYAAIIEPSDFPHTLVDRYRCYELWQLASRCVPGDVLEIGVWRGGTGCLLAKRLQSTAPKKKIYLCDTFTGVVGVTDKDPSYKNGEHSDTSDRIVTALAERMGLTNVKIVRGIFPLETGEALSGLRFSLVHIDVDVYQSAKDCFDWALARLSVGGAVVFDDYGFERCGGVTKLVNELIPTFGSAVATIHNLNGHAVMIKIKENS
jgi:O-methyltransferase